ARVGGTPLHELMCKLEGQPPTRFIGFSITGYPWKDATVGYNSGVCNPYYFGQREIPKDCDGVDWQAVVYKALENGLK
ncbi:MAG TPA: hypothetical protein VEW94_09810, partial [Chloroflexia bacterium]|nr:hypothetical protein [Chloroflexia bacterium]